MDTKDAKDDDEGGLKVCPDCGWRFIKVIGHDRCSPDLGQAADRLAQASPHVKSTKLGYGDGQITFEFGDGFAIGFDVRRSQGAPRFTWDYLHCLASLSEEDATSLVHAICDWRRRSLLGETARHATYRGRDARLQGQGCLVKSGRTWGDAVMAQFDEKGLASSPSGGDLAHGWHEFSRDDFEYEDEGSSSS